MSMTFRYRLGATLVDWLRWTGIRNRLRCPECSAVGTYKPHGGRWDREDVRSVPRWLCKWCGHYRGPEGVRGACVDTVARHWTLYEDLSVGLKPWTPETAMAVGPIPKTWPWKG